MRSDSDATVERRGDLRGRSPAMDALTTHLETALDEAGAHESRFHIRQALQYAEMVSEME